MCSRDKIYSMLKVEIMRAYFAIFMLTARRYNKIYSTTNLIHGGGDLATDCCDRTSELY